MQSATPPNSDDPISRLREGLAAHRQAATVTDYEVLRHDGGDLALTLNAGVLPRTPTALRLHQGGLDLLAPDAAGRLELVGWIAAPAADVLASARSPEGLLVVELSTVGVYSEQSLRALNAEDLAHGG